MQSEHFLGEKPRGFRTFVEDYAQAWTRRLIEAQPAANA
jgi:hypothetical protein